MKYRYHVLAGRELIAAAEYYERASDGLGAEFLDEVDKGILAILDAPERWPSIAPGMRKFRLRRFPYGLVYRLLSSEIIEIVSIMDLRRKPGIWRNR